jgi:hypothetical protein
MRRRFNAIATDYGQTRYKSRLEARFAEHLTRRGEPFEYEPVIRAGGDTYISDFYLPRRHRYIEVKPRECREELKLHAQTILASRAPVLVVDSPRREEFAAYENFNVVKPGRHWMPPRVGARPRGRFRWRVLLACLAVTTWFFWPRQPQPTEPTPTPSAEVQPAAPQKENHHPPGGAKTTPNA